MFHFINWSRAALALEKAAKSAASRDERMTAHYLVKAHRLVLKLRCNLSETRALISLYDRVLDAAQGIGGTMPIRQNCEEMKKMLEEIKQSEWPSA